MESWFRDEVGRVREQVNRALSEVLDDYLDGVDGWLVAPIRYACEGGGKRFRPILFLASYEVAGRPRNNRVIRLATALEIVHSYSLVHDDLPCMDDDDWRRGRATCHRAFGTERATLAAAAMVPLAGWVLAAEAASLGRDPDECARLVAELSQAAGPAGMVGGQVLDLTSEGRDVTDEQLREIHRRKTGALIRAAARLGGLAARVDGSVLEALTRYGAKVGLAFQIADDILDQVEEPAAATPAGDRAMEKATYPGVMGFDRARTTARALADEAIAVLRDGEVDSRMLAALAVHVVERES